MYLRDLVLREAYRVEGVILALTLHSDQMRNISHLPTECTLKILERLEAKSVLRFSSCCKRLLFALKDNLLWLGLALKQFPDLQLSLEETYAGFCTQKSCWDSMFDYYSQMLVPFGAMIGLWHQDYSFFHGGVVHIYVKQKMLVGEWIRPNESPPPALQNFSIDQNVAIEICGEIAYIRRPCFILNSGRQLECAVEPRNDTKLGPHPIQLTWKDVSQHQRTPTHLQLSPLAISERIQDDGLLM